MSGERNMEMEALASSVASQNNARAAEEWEARAKRLADERDQAIRKRDEAWADRNELVDIITAIACHVCGRHVVTAEAVANRGRLATLTREVIGSLESMRDHALRERDAARRAGDEARAEAEQMRRLRDSSEHLRRDTSDRLTAMHRRAQQAEGAAARLRRVGRRRPRGRGVAALPAILAGIDALGSGPADVEARIAARDACDSLAAGEAPAAVLSAAELEAVRGVLLSLGRGLRAEADAINAWVKAGRPLAGEESEG